MKKVIALLRQDLIISLHKTDRRAAALLIPAIMNPANRLAPAIRFRSTLRVYCIASDN